MKEANIKTGVRCVFCGGRCEVVFRGEIGCWVGCAEEGGRFTPCRANGPTCNTEEEAVLKWAMVGRPNDEETQ